MAGLSCALECYDIQLDTIVVEMQAEVGGQITEIPFPVRNVAGGVYDDEHPLPLAARRSAAILGDRVRRSWPVDRTDLGGRWVESAGRRLAADTIVIATGAGLRRLPAAAGGSLRRRRDLPAGVGPRPVRRPPGGGDRRRRQRHARRPGAGPGRVAGHPGAPLRAPRLAAGHRQPAPRTIPGSPSSAVGSWLPSVGTTGWRRWCWCAWPPVNVGRSKPADWW